jgi:hypothetical protein
MNPAFPPVICQTLPTVAKYDLVNKPFQHILAMMGNDGKCG